jgi:hypothetical protein
MIAAILELCIVTTTNILIRTILFVIITFNLYSIIRGRPHLLLRITAIVFVIVINPNDGVAIIIIIIISISISSISIPTTSCPTPLVDVDTATITGVVIVIVMVIVMVIDSVIRPVSAIHVENSTTFRRNASSIRLILRIIDQHHNDHYYY